MIHYQNLAKVVAAIARDIVAAAEVNDMAKVAAARTAMESMAEHEVSLIDSIVSFCQAP